MHTRIKSIAKSVVFLTILITSLYYINRTLMPKYIYKNSTWPTTSSYNQFYKMDRNSVDVLFFGSSVAVNAFSPQEIYNNYGIRSYNLGSEQQSVFLSYYWLKEALRFQSPRVVVLDTRFLFELHPENPINTTEGLTRKCLDPMKWSPVKAEAVSALCKIDSEQSELSYYLTNIRFHTRWESLTEYDILYKEVQTAKLKGYSPIEEYGPDTYETYTFGGDLETVANPHTIMKEYLDKMTELCEEEGISFILVSLPGNPMSDGINNMLSLYAEEYKVDYYNLCETEMYNSIGAILPRESVIIHENLWGSIKMSKFIGKMLSENYGISEVEDYQYEETRDYYEHIIKNCELPHIININEYLQAINDDRYTIFISASGDSSAGLTDEIKQNLRSLGISNDFEGKYGWSYCAVISPETGINEETGIEKIICKGSIRDRKTIYTISSEGELSGNSISSIVIDWTEYSKNMRGMNIVVYDNSLMKVVDTVCFNTSGDCAAVR